MASKYTISMVLNVIRGDRVLVPGCEPTSTLTSTDMMAQMREQGLCQCSIVELADILAAVPGAYTKFIPNSGHTGSRKLLVFPPYDQTCPCSPRPDYYQVMRDLCRDATEDEVQELVGCDSFAMGSCDKQPQWRGQV